MAINEVFVECLAKFSAAYGSYKLLYNEETGTEEALTSILKDTKKSFTDVSDSLQELGAGLEGAVQDYVNEFSDIGSDIKNQLLDLVKDPFSNISKTIYGQVDKDLLNRITTFFEEQGIKGTVLNTSHFMATMILSAIKGVATIENQKKLLSQLDKQVTSVMNRIYDTPDVTPPIHPFKDTLYHLKKSKENFQSTSSQLITKSRIDYTRYDTGVSEMKLASKSLLDGTMSQSFLDQSGLGNLVQIKRESGQVSLVPLNGLKAYHFLPPINLAVNIFVIKKIRDQIAVYNGNLSAVDQLIRSVVDNLYLTMDIGRFLGSMIQYFVFEIKSMQNSLEGASTTPVIGPDSITLQGEVYGRLLGDILIAEKTRKVLERFNTKDVNDVPALKAFRAKLRALDTSKCGSVYIQLDAAIAGFVNAYHRRVAGRSNAHTLQYAGNNVKAYIKRQRDYLDCIQDALSTLSLGPIDPQLMNLIAGVGSTLAALQSVSLDTLLTQMLNKNFNAKAYLVSFMKQQIDCMMKACQNPGVHGLLTKLLDEIVILQKILNSNYTLTADFARQAKFSSKYESGKFAQLLQQFINSIQRLSC